jgi:hypothetical protein
MLRNVAGQKWRVFAFDRGSNEPVTGDAANITAKISVDFATPQASSDTNPTEAEDGYYYFLPSQAETNGNITEIFPESSTPGVQVIGVPARELPASAAILSIGVLDPNYNVFIYSAGATLYAFPASVSHPFSGWATHRVLCTEIQPGLYQAVIDAEKSLLWTVFEGATQPTTHDDAIQTLAFGGLSSGNGPNTVAITVELGVDPVIGASVRLSKSGYDYTVQTDNDGIATFNIPSGTWTVAISGDGISFTGATLVVSADTEETYAVSSASVSIPPSDPGKRTVYYTCIGSNGSALAGATVYATCLQAPGTGLAMMGTARYVTSDGNGLASFTNCIVGATYEFNMGNGRKVAATIPSGTTPVSLESIVGK